MNQLRKFWRLPLSDRWLLCVAWGLLASMRLRLWLLPCRYWLQRVNRPPSPSLCRQPLPGAGFSPPSDAYHSGSAPSQQHTEIARLRWSIRIASRLLPGQVKCLARALTMRQLMVWRGYTPDLKIGVALTQTGALEAHAWVDCDGVVAIGNLPDLDRYTPLPSLHTLPKWSL